MENENFDQNWRRFDQNWWENRSKFDEILIFEVDVLNVAEVFISGKVWCQVYKTFFKSFTLRENKLTDVPGRIV
jgi:hypothetical protein